MDDHRSLPWTSREPHARQLLTGRRNAASGDMRRFLRLSFKI